jgi:DCN1-like protein 1/2
VFAKVDPADVVMLVLSWHFGAATMCEYSKDEFIQGMISLRCDSIEKLRRRLPELRTGVLDDVKFKV